MKKVLGTLFAIVMSVVSLNGYATEGDSLSHDTQYQYVYYMATQVAETAGIDHYEITVDDYYNATILILDEMGNAVRTYELGGLHFAHDPNEEDLVQALNDKITKQNEQIDLLNTSITEANSQIDAASVSISEKDDQIKLLISSAAIKDAKIETLEKETSEKTSAIKALEGSVMEKDSTIKALEADAKEKNAVIEELRTDVKNKTEALRILESEVNGKAAWIDELSANLSEKTVKIEALEEETKKKKKKIEKLMVETSEKEERIEALEKDVTNKDKEINGLASDVANKAMEIDQLKTTVKNKEILIETMTATASKKDKEISDLSSDVSDKAVKIEALISENNSQAAQLLIFKRMIAEESSSTDPLTNSLLVIVPTKEYVIDRLSSIKEIGTIAAVTIDNDPNGQLGKKGQYIEQIFFSSPLVNPDYANLSDKAVIDAGTICGGSIEVYRTISDAEARNQHLAFYDGTESSSGSHIVLGTLVIRTSSALSLSEQRQLENEITTALIKE